MLSLRTRAGVPAGARPRGALQRRAGRAEHRARWPGGAHSPGAAARQPGRAPAERRRRRPGTGLGTRETGRWEEDQLTRHVPEDDDDGAQQGEPDGPWPRLPEEPPTMPPPPQPGRSQLRWAGSPLPGSRPGAAVRPLQDSPARSAGGPQPPATQPPELRPHEVRPAPEVRRPLEAQPPQEVQPPLEVQPPQEVQPPPEMRTAPYPVLPEGTAGAPRSGRRKRVALAVLALLVAFGLAAAALVLTLGGGGGRAGPGAAGEVHLPPAVSAFEQLLAESATARVMSDAAVAGACRASAPQDPGREALVNEVGRAIDLRSSLVGKAEADRRLLATLRGGPAALADFVQAADATIERGPVLQGLVGRPPGHRLLRRADQRPQLPCRDCRAVGGHQGRGAPGERLGPR